MTALVIAAHGTRDAEGEKVAHDLVARVAELLPDTPVSVGFVELSLPSVPDAVAAALENDDHVVVVPLMLGTGMHSRDDIPGFIREVRETHPNARIDYSRHLGREELLARAVERRLGEALGDWDPAETALVWIGRGALVPQSNQDHVMLGERFERSGRWHSVHSGFIQVTEPRIPETLDNAYASGAKQILVMGHWLFPGRLRTWTFEQSEAWAEKHPDTQVRIAEVIGACDELAELVVRRFQETAVVPPVGGSPVYLSGLLIDGRDVLIVGAGPVALRRARGLIEARAYVHIVAPEATPELEDWAARGVIDWQRREFQESDLDDKWYVVAATDNPEVNRAVAESCERRHTFCVRADRAWGGSAWTPATTRVGATTVGVISRRDPKHTRELRDHLAEYLAKEA